MQDKELEKYFDLLISKIKNSKEFNILKTLKSEIEPLGLNNEDKNNFAHSLADFGSNKNLIGVINRSTGWYNLTDKGIKLKQSELTLKKFIKKESKKEWYNENWIGFAIAFIILMFTIFQYFDNRSVIQERDFIKSQLDSCKSQLSDSLQKSEIKMRQLKLNTLTMYDSIN